MADTERKIIPIAGRQASQYIEAIEGLIFDPQSYKTPEVKTAENGYRNFLRLPWLRKQREIASSTPDPVKDSLDRRYGDVISRRFYELTEGGSESEPEIDAREFVYSSPLYKINERPSLLVDAGTGRRYQIDLQLVRDRRYLIVFSFLHLQQVEMPQSEANLMLCGPQMMRVQRNGQEGDLYTPSFAEQQRLLALNELLRKHIKPTKPPRS